MSRKELNREPNRIVLAKQDFTGPEKDLFYFAINELPPDKIGQSWPKEKAHIVTLRAKDVPHINRGNIKNIFERLQKRCITYESQDKNTVSVTSIFTFLEYKKGVIQLALNGALIPDLTALRAGYSVYDLKEALSLKGIHSKRIFEMLSAYANRNKNIFIIEINQLKKMLNIENSYINNHSNLKKRIIEPAIQQINTKTSLIIVFELKRKEGVTTAYFTVNRKKKNNKYDLATIENLSDVQKWAIGWIKHMEFTPKQSWDIITTEEKLQAFIKYVKNYEVEIKQKARAKSQIRAAFFHYIKTGSLDLDFKK